MAPHQERVVAEKAELDEKLTKLSAFLETEVFEGLPIEDRALLCEQKGVMDQYSDVLARRIARF